MLRGNRLHPVSDASRRRLHHRAAAVVLLAGLVLLVGACGYHTKSLYPANVHTVAVPIFQNRTFYRGVEFDLTEAVIKEIERRTPYKVVASDKADTLLSGTITEVQQNVLSRSEAGGLPQEMRVTLVVDLEWTDIRRGGVLRSRQGLSEVGRYIPARAVGQPYTTAQHEAVERMASLLVSTLRQDW